MTLKNQNGKVTFGDLPPLMVKVNAFRDMYSEDEIRGILGESGTDFTNDIDFEMFLKVSGLVPSILSFNITRL